MKRATTLFQPLSILLAASILFASCSSTTLLTSSPSGAKVYLNGQSVGTTPYSHSDTRIVGSRTDVRLVLEGYEPLYTTFSRDERVDVGAVIGGIFLLVPFLWTMEYNPTHNWELSPVGTNPAATSNKVQLVNPTGASKLERLKSLKQLLDDKALTQEEYGKEKTKILEEK